MKKGKMDIGILILVFILLTVGLIMCFSASEPFAFDQHEDGMYFIKRQLIWAVLGLFAMFFMANFHYKNLQKLSLPLFLISVVLLILVLLVGIRRNGAIRWLGYGPITFQPSELVKLSIILHFANLLSKDKNKKIKNFLGEGGLLWYLAHIGIIAILLMLEPHTSGTILIGTVGCILLLIAGARMFHFMLLGVPVGLLGWIILQTSEYRMNRVTAFMDPFAHIKDMGWQICQALYAIGSGKILGVGFSKSVQKHLYVPEPQNDFIFAILCEEFGFIGALVVISFFMVLIVNGIIIAMNSPDNFSALVAAGITSLIALQVIINIAVVTSSMPVTGMPLPFFSAGGSSLLFLMGGMGILLNISKYSKMNYSKAVVNNIITEEKA